MLWFCFIFPYQEAWNELVCYTYKGPSFFLNAVCTISKANGLCEVHGLGILSGDGKHSMCHISRSRLVFTEQWVLGAVVPKMRTDQIPIPIHYV